MRKLAALFLLLALCAGAVTLDDAVLALARKVQARLAPGAVVRISSRNLSSLGAAEAGRAQATLERALRRRPARQSPQAELRFTLGENVREIMLVAEIMQNEASDVVMVPWRPEAPPRRVLPVLARRLLWEQERPMLDVALAEDRMLVLETDALYLFERRPNGWEPAASRAIDAPPARDPRGRIELDGPALAVFLPGTTCRGAWKPALDLKCEARPAEFSQNGEAMRFVRGRNTLEANLWPPFYSYARLDTAARALHVLAETDGRAHLYDDARKPLGVIDEWDGDLAAACDGRILAVRNTSVAAYSLSEARPVAASEPVEFPGPVSALWPAPGGAVVIVRVLNSGRYAAYSLTLDCGR
ncbi:MAG: hypothetical protein HY858_13045 [Candidatus Solibacter usitatus]|nr:hypothetical protein [Candidatus Solibacter usitatus]